MIERKILYYPTILVPTEWLRQTILYWDKVCSIVPEYWEEISYWHTKEQVERHQTMNYLENEGEYEPVRPRTFTGWSTLTEEFKKIVNSPQFQSKIAKNKYGYVVKDKISNSISDFLKEKKLLIQDSRDSNLYIVEESTALLYLSLLAKYMADQQSDYTIPSTDLEEYQTIIYESNDFKNGFPSLNTKFLNALPVPRDDVPLRDIIKFKRQRKSELLEFREIIDGIEKEISHAESNEEIKKSIVQYQEKFKSETFKIKSKMKDSNIKTIWASFNSLIDYKKPSLWEVVATSTGFLPPNISIPLIATTATVQVGWVWIDNINKQRAELRESPYSYLYYAEKKRVI